MMPLIEASHLAKEYGTVKALEDISLAVNSGDFFAIIGPSGSGKSTLLRLLGLIEPPSSGKILFTGQNATSGSDDLQLRFRREIGMVFQDAVLLNTSVHENVAYPLKVRKKPQSEIERRVKKSLDAVKLSGFEKRNALELSGGEAQRVSLAQALVYDPKLLLLDEPTVNLDPRNATIIENTVSRLNQEQGTAVIMATHNMQQVQFLASEGAILRDGRLVERGRISELFDSPSTFLSIFGVIGNVFEGESEVGPDGLATIDIGAFRKIEATTGKRGKVTVVIRPEDIIVSKEALQSSARNQLRGKVVEISQSGQRVRMKVDVGRQFLVTMTRRSFDEMKLELGSLVFLAFKASSVNVV